jgi:hypothetical protein
MSERDIDTELERLTKATESIRPRPDFTARVMGKIAGEQSFWFELPRVARVLVPLAALAAAVGVVWGVATSDVVDTALADGDDDGVEVTW